MRVFSKMSLSVKLIAVVMLVSVLVLSIFSTLNLNTLRMESVSRAEAEAQNAGLAYKEQLSSTLQGYESTLTALSQSLMNMKTEMSRDDAIGLLKRLLQKNPGVMGIYTLWEPGAYDGKDEENVNRTKHDDKTGRFIPYVTGSGDQMVVQPLAGYATEGAGAFYLQPKSTKKMQYYYTVYNNESGKDLYVMSIVKPILDEQGQFLGIVGLDLSLEHLQAEAAKYKPMGGYVTLITSTGIYAANPYDETIVGKPFGDRPQNIAIWKNVSEGGVNKGYSLNSKGIEVQRTFEKLMLPGSEQAWYVQIVVPKAIILQNYDHSRLVTIELTIAAMLVLGIVLAIMLRMMIIRPVQIIGEKMNRMAEGDLTQQIDLHSRDEIGRMAQAFNTMSARLREMFGMVYDLAFPWGLRPAVNGWC